MGLLKRFKGRPITGATRPQTRPANIRQGEGGLAAQSQIAAPPSPFQNPRGTPNFQRNRTNQAATVGVGDGRSRNSANIAGGRPMTDSQVMRGAGYTKAPNYRGFDVHQPAKQGRRKPLVKPMSNQDFLEGAKLYHKEHGGL
jgi:hypothetical protein